MLRASFATVAMVTVLAVAGCASASNPGATGGAPSSPAEPTSSAPGSSPTVDTSGVPAAILAPVVADAAVRAGIDPGSLAVASAEAVTWPDGSLGCPAPGTMYTQALVSGWRIVVRAGDQQLDYRVRGPGDFKICERGLP